MKHVRAWCGLQCDDCGAVNCWSVSKWDCGTMSVETAAVKNPSQLS